jgi:hypothetical protein
MDKEISLLAITLEKYLVIPFSSIKGVSMVVSQPGNNGIED